MKFLITGAAGFIGSSLVDRLLSLNHEVIGVDNFSTGIEKYLTEANKNSKFKLVVGDLLTPCLLDNDSIGVDAVFHLAANADIRGGLSDPKKDLEQGILATFNVLEAMRASNVKKIIFASSAAALGEPSIFPTPETVQTPVQTSVYGATKMACEGIISAYCEGYQFEGYAFRFVSLMGPRYPHGHVYDFVKQLLVNPSILTVLGDGSQKKSYMHISDCLDAITNIPLKSKTALKAKHRFEVYHLGYPDYCMLKESIGWIVSELDLKPTIDYGLGNKGWVGDNPFVFLDVKKAVECGWNPKHGIEDSVRETVRWLVENQWIFANRK